MIMLRSRAKQFALLPLSVAALTTLGAIAVPTAAQADPLPPWCALPHPFGPPPGCQQPTPQAQIPTPQAPPSPSTPAPNPYTSNVVFDVYGSGTVNYIDTEPSGDGRVSNVSLPWRRVIAVGRDVSRFGVFPSGYDSQLNKWPGCQITLGGKVVARQDIGGAGSCFYSRSEGEHQNGP